MTSDIDKKTTRMDSHEIPRFLRDYSQLKTQKYPLCISARRHRV